MIWFSASCSFTALPNSVGLLALPLRMISVDGSNRLTKIGPPFALERLVAPVAHVLEDQQAKNHLGRRAAAATTAAPRMALRQGLIDGRHQLFVRQYSVGMRHHGSRRSSTSAAIRPSPKLSCARRISIMARASAADGVATARRPDAANGD